MEKILTFAKGVLILTTGFAFIFFVEMTINSWPHWALFSVFGSSLLIYAPLAFLVFLALESAISFPIDKLPEYEGEPKAYFEP